MAENKKSFILYCDLIHTVRKMPKDKAGDLFMTILSFVNDENPTVDDMLVDLVFEPVKQQLKRDLKSWESYREKQSERGKLGGRGNKATALSEKPPLYLESEKSLNANVNANVNATDTVKRENRTFSPPPKDDILNFFMEKLDDFTAMAESDKFFFYYESNGWKVGKNKMKDWKSAAAGWISRIVNFKTEKNATFKNTNGSRVTKSTGAENLLESLRQDYINLSGQG